MEEKATNSVNREGRLPLPEQVEIPEVDFENMPISQWRYLSMAYRMCSELLLKSTGLTDVGQPALLVVLAASPDCTSDSQKLLAEKLHVTPATITVSLRSMQRNGYVTKETVEADLRRKRISLTEKGKEASRLLNGFSNLLDSEMYKGFTEEERDKCAEYFQRMTKNLEESATAIRKVIKRRQQQERIRRELEEQELYADE